MKTFEELKAEAIARGIKPGAKIACAYGKGEGIVQPYEQWVMYYSSMWCGTDQDRWSLRAWDEGKWATVITPAPEDQSEGLVDGMACEPDEHMRRAIVEKAKELGICRFEYDRAVGYECIQMLEGVIYNMLNRPSNHLRTWLTPGEFYDRLCSTKKPEPPIQIGPNNVVFNKGSIKVGCTEVHNDIVRKVAERLKD